MDKKTPIIMVIEDEDLLLRAITKKLNALGIKTVSCVNGKQALDYLTNFEELPDAIWLDYCLTDINGIDFMYAIKQNDKTKNIPVIVVSNSAGEDKVKTMLALGAKEYYLKAEYRLDDLIEKIKSFIQKN